MRTRVVSLTREGDEWVLVVARIQQPRNRSTAPETTATKTIRLPVGVSATEIFVAARAAIEG